MKKILLLSLFIIGINVIGFTQFNCTYDSANQVITNTIFKQEVARKRLLPEIIRKREQVQQQRLQHRTSTCIYDISEVQINPQDGGANSSYTQTVRDWCVAEFSSGGELGTTIQTAVWTVEPTVFDFSDFTEGLNADYDLITFQGQQRVRFKFPGTATTIAAIYNTGNNSVVCNLPYYVLHGGVQKQTMLVESNALNDTFPLSGRGGGSAPGLILTKSNTSANTYTQKSATMHELGHAWGRPHTTVPAVYMNVAAITTALTYGSADAAIIAAEAVSVSDGWSGGPCEVDGTLPLELITFQPLIYSRATIQLQWQTANEVGTDPMLLYRSRDGVEWEMIFATNSKGSRVGSYYTYLDENLTDGIYYYKLETNGKSWIRTVKLGSVVAPVALYPNPTDGIVHLSEPQSTLSLYNPIGQLIANYETTNEIDLSQLPKGIYYLELENGERKMVVKK